MPLSPLAIADADVRLDAAWLPRAQADALFAAVRAEVPWSVHRIRLFGRWVDSPRLSAWMGDAHARYRYSGATFEPLPWTPALAGLRTRVEEALGIGFDSVLANLYRDGRDAMGWHRDDEPELGPAPVIASVSLGATRRFVLRRAPARGARAADAGAARERHAIELPHGSLLVMAGATQAHWQHALPRTTRPVGERVNLTFRCVGG